MKKAPHTYTLIFGIIIVMAILTYIIPAGQFDRKEVKLSNGMTKTLVVADSYKPVDRNPQGIKEVLMSPIKGVEDAAAVVGFILLIGGAFGVISKTGAIEAGLSKMVRTVEGKEIIIIPIIMFLFSLGGTTFGMCEETIPFYMVFIPLMMSLGYDSLTGFMMVFMGAATGTAASTTNPFSVGIAQAISELAPGSGVDFRWVQYIIFIAVSIIFVMLYARRVKKHPEKSPVYEIDKSNKEFFTHNAGDADKIKFTWDHAVILIGFAAGIVIMIYGVKKFGWYIEEISMVFFGIALFAGIVSAIARKMNSRDIAESFVEGCKSLTYAAVICGLARGILVVAKDGNIIDTILNSAANALKGLPKEIFATLMMLVQNLIAFLIPSSSGQAALTMPVMAPLADLMKVDRQVAVTAYQYGTGITNMLTPTSGTLMAALGIARIPWNKWAKFILPMILVFFVIAAIFLFIGIGIYPVA